jgi:ribosome-associated toxin RatA of RatAB toxin-antitoxin module
MTPIIATDELIVPFPRDLVWKVLENFSSYPDWWPRSVGLSIVNLEPELLGSTFQLRPMGGRAFYCRVESMDEPNSIRMQYFGGFIEGRGEWRIESVEDLTRIQYELDVLAAGRMVAWIGRIFPLGRFHSFQMKDVLSRLERQIKKVAENG